VADPFWLISRKIRLGMSNQRSEWYQEKKKCRQRAIPTEEQRLQMDVSIARVDFCIPDVQLSASQTWLVAAWQGFVKPQADTQPHQLPK
jgi:hypothetical protein